MMEFYLQRLLPLQIKIIYVCIYNGYINEIEEFTEYFMRISFQSLLFKLITSSKNFYI